MSVQEREDTSQVMKDPGRINKLCSSMYMAWQTSQFCDLNLRARDSQRVIPVHKVVIYSLSEYFKALFEMDLRADTRIMYIDTDYYLLLQIVKYAYTGEVDIDCYNVQSLFIASDYLQIDFIKLSCEKFMITNLDKSNCFTCYNFSSTFSIPKLEKESLNFILRHFTTLNNTDEFLQLALPAIQEIIACEDVVMFDEHLPLSCDLVEEELLKGLLNYIQTYTIEDSVITEMLQKIRLNYIDKERLLQKLQAAPTVWQITNVQTLSQYRDADKLPEELSHWRKPRNVAEVKKLKNRKSFASGGQIQPILGVFEDDDKVDARARIRKIELFIRLWDDRRIIGGLAVEYSNGVRLKHGLSESSERVVDKHIVELGPKEVITCIELNSGWMIDCLTFHTIGGETNPGGHKYGPFGGDGGSEAVAKPPGDNSGYLFAFSGSEVNDQGCESITFLNFTWLCWSEKKHQNSIDH